MKPSDWIGAQVEHTLRAERWSSDSEAAVAHAKINAVIAWLDHAFAPYEVPPITREGIEALLAGPRGPRTPVPPSGANGPSEPCLSGSFPIARLDD